jgi:hypothetical protein
MWNPRLGHFAIMFSPYSYDHIRHIFYDSQTFLPKNDYIIKLSIIVMNFNMCVTTTSHYSHLDYEFKLLFMYVMNM